jgi:hypothetical protein
MNWQKISTISLWAGLAIALIHAFLGKYLKGYFYVTFPLEILLLVIFIISEIAKFLQRRNSKKRRNI